MFFVLYSLNRKNIDKKYGFVIMKTVIKMVVNYDIEKINDVLLDFYNATGINMDLLREDFSPVSGRPRADIPYCRCVQQTGAGKKACLRSDALLLEKCRRSRKAQMQICHAGLVDAAAPILYDDVIIGYIIFGQMKTDTDFSALQAYLAALGLDAGEMESHYTGIPFFDSGKMQSLSNIASMLVKHILLEDLLKPDFDESIQKAVTFIQENLEKELSVRIISKSINVSKSVLYKRFHACFGCTVSEYNNTRRVEHSLELLKKSDLSVEEISRRSGFSSASYYSKTFKKLKGIAPLKYRKNYRSK